MEIDGLDEGALRRILSRVASVNPGAVAQEIAVLRGEEGSKLNAAARPQVVEAGAPAAELSPEQKWLGEFRARFSYSLLRKLIQWADVEESLKADPESMRKLQNLDEKGHKMVVSGEENGEFIIGSAWSDSAEVSEDHRNIVFDAEAQRSLAENHPNETCNGNATDIAKVLGVDLADQKFHEKLIKVTNLNGWAWVKTDAAMRTTGIAAVGRNFGIDNYIAEAHDNRGSLRVELKVKKKKAY